MKEVLGGLGLRVGGRIFLTVLVRQHTTISAKDAKNLLKMSNSLIFFGSYSPITHQEFQNGPESVQGSRVGIKIRCLGFSVRLDLAERALLKFNILHREFYGCW